MRFLYDTSIFVYARGREHFFREPCRSLVRLAEEGVLTGEASVELIQEYAHLLRRRGMGGAEVRQRARGVATLCLMHEVSEADVDLALNLVATNPKMQVRDGIHAATALRRGVPIIVSADRGFDGIDGLQRLDPQEAIRQLVPRQREGS